MILILLFLFVFFFLCCKQSWSLKEFSKPYNKVNFLRLKWRHVMIKINWTFCFYFSCLFFGFRWLFCCSEALMQKYYLLGLWIFCVDFSQWFLIKISTTKVPTQCGPKKKSHWTSERVTIKKANIVHKLTAIVERCRAKENNKQTAYCSLFMGSLFLKSQ